MFETLRNCHPRSVEILCASVSLMLSASTKNYLDENQFKVKQMLQAWIEGDGVIGSRGFGGRKVQNKLLQGDKELKVMSNKFRKTSTIIILIKALGVC